MGDYGSREEREPAPGRPKLSLAPRGTTAPSAAPTASSKPNPFGAAKPREQVIAARTGVSEEAVIKSAVAADKPKLRLSREQQDDVEALEGELAHAKKEAEEASPGSAAAAAAAATAERKEAELKTLLDGFEVCGAASWTAGGGLGRRGRWALNLKGREKAPVPASLSTRHARR